MITYLKQPRLSHPQLLAAWPGMGYVAFRTVTYLIDALGGERFAFIQPGDYFSPTGVAVEDSQARIPPLPSSVFYYWKNSYSEGDLVFFLGDAQPSAGLQLQMAREVVALAKKMGVYRLWTFAAAPAAIQYKDTSRVCGVGNTQPLKNYLSACGVRLLRVGHISGLNGLLLGAASREDLPGVCLLGEIPYYTVNLENPRACRSILRVLQKALSLRLDFSGLDEDIRKFDREITRIGKKAQETMATFMEPEEEEAVAGGFPEPEEEEEEGRPLPEPARRRIEELFRKVKLDPSLAPLLKTELDKWGVYPLYEDRFLDLFRGEEERKDN